MNATACPLGCLTPLRPFSASWRAVWVTWTCSHVSYIWTISWSSLRLLRSMLSGWRRSFRDWSMLAWNCHQPNATFSGQTEIFRPHCVSWWYLHRPSENPVCERMASSTEPGTVAKFPGFCGILPAFHKKTSQRSVGHCMTFSRALDVTKRKGKVDLSLRLHSSRGQMLSKLHSTTWLLSVVKLQSSAMQIIPAPLWCTQMPALMAWEQCCTRNRMGGTG